MIFMLKNSSYTLFSFGCHSDLWYSVILIDIWTKLSVGVCILSTQSCMFFCSCFQPGRLFIGSWSFQIQVEKSLYKLLILLPNYEGGTVFNYFVCL